MEAVLEAEVIWGTWGTTVEDWTVATGESSPSVVHRSLNQFIQTTVAEGCSHHIMSDADSW